MFNIGGWALFRKSERLLFGVRLYVSHEVISKPLPDALTMYHDLNFGIEDLPRCWVWLDLVNPQSWMRSFCSLD